MDRTPFQRYRPKLAALASEEGARAAIERAATSLRRSRQLLARREIV